MRKLIYLSTLLLLFVLPLMAQQPLFPTPAKVQNAKGSFIVGKNLQVQGNGGYADKLAAGLQAELKEAGMQSSLASGTIRLELTDDCKMVDEAYTLVVEPNSILLQASFEA
ncbi:glycoside hydrolase family 20 zincin-like fold domain-containing protein, partial [uncultured Parabacteroides sp.]